MVQQRDSEEKELEEGPEAHDLLQVRISGLEWKEEEKRREEESHALCRANLVKHLLPIGRGEHVPRFRSVGSGGLMEIWAPHADPQGGSMALTQSMPMVEYGWF